MSDVPTPPPANDPNAVPAPRPYDGAAGAQTAQNPGKTLGIVAFVLSFFLQLIALILGIVALVQSRKAGQKNGFALAAIIISVVLGIAAIVGGILLVLGAAAFGEPYVEAVQICQQNGYTGTVEVDGQVLSCAEIAP